MPPRLRKSIPTPPDAMGSIGFHPAPARKCDRAPGGAKRCARRQPLGERGRARGVGSKWMVQKSQFVAAKR